MVDKSINKSLMKLFVLATKVIPMLLAFCHFLNTALSYCNIDCVFLNYIGGISILTVIYLYFASYALRLCNYYRMFLHYCVAIDVINILDYYIGISITDYSMFLVYVMITIITMFMIIYLKFFKCEN